VRAVPQLAAAALEPAGELNNRLAVNRAAEKRPSCFECSSCDDFRALRYQMVVSVVRSDNYPGRMRNCQLLARDLFRRLAEYVCVLKRHVGEQDDGSIDNVGGVEPSPEPGLDDRGIDLTVREFGEGRRRQRFELRGAELFRGPTYSSDRLLEVGLGAVDPDALRPPTDVRRGVGARSPPLPRQESGGAPRACRQGLGPPPPPPACKRAAIVRVAVDLPFVPTT